MKNTTEIYYQTANRKYIEEEYGKSQWVQISGNQELHGASAEFWCALLKIEKIDIVFMNHGWDVTGGDGVPGFECYGDKCEYRKSLLEDGLEQLIYYRTFYGIRKPFIELSQEFVLLNNIFFDEQKRIYYSMLADGTTDEVVRVNGEDNVSIKLSYLLRFAAAKQMAIILYYDIRTNFEATTTSLGVNEFSDEHKDSQVFYQIWGGDLLMLESKAFSVLMGKKIIYPNPVETCGYWPYEKEQEFTDYIIGIDENGNEKTFTCNPDKLADYFGKNPEAPHYLTPVFFKREVLQKYFAHPELYKISDGYLECGALWRVEIDNHHKNVVSVYLGDLGRDLPESERLYWRSYNIASDEGLSETSYKRDFLGMFTDSNMIEHRFREHYIQTNDAWNKKYGWPLFLPLSDKDQYNFDLLRIPLTESQEEFDGLVLSLVKILIDSLNEKKIKESIESESELKGIGKLEKWLEASGCCDFEDHIKFLRDLQELRSRGTGHRKGTDYNKIASSFGVGIKELRDVFEDILTRADKFLDYMANITS